MSHDTYKIRILLAEDNLATGQLYRQMMESKGFEVDHAHDGHQALEFAQNGGYTLILMDIRMPGIDGLKVLEKLSQNPPKKKNGPIVMLTNLVDEALVKQAIGLGALSYVDKSNLNPQELVAKINGVLGLPAITPTAPELEIV